MAFILPPMKSDQQLFLHKSSNISTNGGRKPKSHSFAAVTEKKPPTAVASSDDRFQRPKSKSMSAAQSTRKTSSKASTEPSQTLQMRLCPLAIPEEDVACKEEVTDQQDKKVRSSSLSRFWSRLLASKDHESKSAT